MIKKLVKMTFRALIKGGPMFALGYFVGAQRAVTLEKEAS